MWESNRSFPAWIKNTYDAVEKRSSESECSLPREEAVLVIQAAGDDRRLVRETNQHRCPELYFVG